MTNGLKIALALLLGLGIGFAAGRKTKPPPPLTRVDLAPAPAKKNYVAVDIEWLSGAYEAGQYRWYEFAGCEKTNTGLFRADILTALSDYGFEPIGDFLNAKEITFVGTNSCLLVLQKTKARP